MIANIYIEGPIGQYAQDVTDYIELVDVVAQVERYKKQGQIERYNFLVNSPGGVVEVGEQIEEYMIALNKEVPVYTITNGMVASIASIIYLAADSDKRLIREGDVIMIHNPWSNPAGDADQLREHASRLDKVEKRLAEKYAAKTGVDQTAINSLMDNETFIDADKAVELNFAHKKITSDQLAKKAEVVAVFKIDKPTKKRNPMSDKNKKFTDMSFEEVFDSLKNLFNKKEGGDDDAKNVVDYTTSDGTRIQVSADNEESLIGADAFVIDAENNSTPAPEGEHKLDNGKTLVVDANSKVTDLKEESTEEGSEGDDEAALKKENENLKASNKKLEDEVAQMKKTLEAALGKAEVDHVVAVMKGNNEELTKAKQELAAIQSAFNIPEGRTFAKAETQEKSKYEKARERRENHAKKERFKEI